MTAASEREPSEIELLLPWHAAGMLERDDAQQVEAALASDPELARHYEWARDEFAQETYLNEAVGEPSERDVETLFAKIDAVPARRPAASMNLGARISEFFTSLSPRTLAWSAMAAALAIVLQSGLIADMMIAKNKSGGYETATVPADVSGAGSYALVRFQPQATAAEIANFLETNKLSIVGGPSAGTLYRVRIASTKLPKADLTGIVKTLQGDKVVGFIAVTE
jgi:anti-sigma factor RsiW